MKQFSAEVDIEGSPEDVWAVLSNAEAYPDWDPTMTDIEGSIGLNEKLVLQTTLSKRSFNVTVKEFTPNRRMVWTSGMPLGLFKGERSFELTPRDGGVHFRLHEVFSGLMSPLIGRMVPDMHPAFLKFVQGLKAEVESRKKTEAAG